MRERIRQELNEIEKKFDVKILYACESGSRAWGFSSEDSDYDVRFIYIHKKDWYLSIDQRRDVIELPVSNLLDISGWELTKALRLFRKSNPSLFEWMYSGIVYYEQYSVMEKMKQMIEKVYLPAASLHHYLNMAKGNVRSYLQGDEVQIKKYFYAIRPVLACQWIEKYKTVPPVEFSLLLEKMIPEDVLENEIKQLLTRKMTGEKLEAGHKVQVINDFLDSEIERLLVYTKSLDVKKEDPTSILNQLFRETLDEVWEN
ncbi:nucleotidyltransferase domain-containing protein [Metabacillus fastidiosus]|uniref:nucleotidyltransferase domain-containing protein n=1 Tax=Metabacillus fastidiosus TaxID=1458 RepID=UPI002DBF21E9|nr:nucleotidyltransferase domain-containing protein [Metabacillus fastidiosus]MEC2077180.1 nucleotidyltransferase domain-containing protein [Metabacillus fastidiosus]